MPHTPKKQKTQTVGSLVTKWAKENCKKGEKITIHQTDKLFLVTKDNNLI